MAVGLSRPEFLLLTWVPAPRIKSGGMLRGESGERAHGPSFSRALPLRVFISFQIFRPSRTKGWRALVRVPSGSPIMGRSNKRPPWRLRIPFRTGLVGRDWPHRL